MTIELTPWDTSQQLQTREDIVLFLGACLEQAADDAPFISTAIETVAHSPALAQLSAGDELREGILNLINAHPSNIAQLLSEILHIKISGNGHITSYTV